MTTTRAPLLIILGAGLVLAGCTEPAASSASGTGSPPSPSASATPPSAPETAPATAPASSTPTASAKASSPCPVPATKLLAAFRGSKVERTLAPTKRLTKVECHSGYALAQTNPVEADRAVVVFRYSAGAWHAVNGGTGDYCDRFVPEAIAARFDRC